MKVRALLTRGLMCMLGLLAAGVARGESSEWFCREDAASRSANRIKVCGVGSASTLEQARRLALVQAKQEFLSLCKESDDCRGFAFNVKPLRTDCEAKGEKQICYRGLEYTILEKRDSQQLYDEEIAQLTEREEVLREEMARVREIQQRRARVHQLESAASSGDVASLEAGLETPRSKSWRIKVGVNTVTPSVSAPGHSIPVRMAPGIGLAYRVLADTYLEVGLDHGIVGGSITRATVSLPIGLKGGVASIGPEVHFETGGIATMVEEPNPFWKGTDWEGRTHQVERDVPLESISVGGALHLRPFRSSGFQVHLGGFQSIAQKAGQFGNLAFYLGGSGEFDF